MNDIIFESKNGRWMITRGKGKWNVRDNQSHIKISVTQTARGLMCKEPLPDYVLKHIKRDAERLEALKEAEV